MKKPKYFTIEELILKIDEPNRAGCRRIYSANLKLFSEAAGSSHNHQNWPGGYLDHTGETMNIAVLLYDALGAARHLPFSLSDALLILSLHDLEKPWKSVRRFADKEDRRKFREYKLGEYIIILTPAQENALRYVEGEGDAYTNSHRVMNELAAFCHMCDVWSARGWYAYPAAENDPWTGAKRSGE